MTEPENESRNQSTTRRASKLKVLIFWNQLEDAEPGSGAEPAPEGAAVRGAVETGEVVADRAAARDSGGTETAGNEAEPGPDGEGEAGSGAASRGPGDEAVAEPGPDGEGAEDERAEDERAEDEDAQDEDAQDEDAQDEDPDDEDPEGLEADADADADDPLVRQVNDIAEALSDGDLTVAAINIEDDIDRIIDGIVLERPALIFNLVDQFYGDNTQHAAVASLFDLLGIAFTGSDPSCLSTCQERARTRLLLDNADIPLPGYAVVRDVNVLPDITAMRYPLIVTQAFDDIYDDEGETHPLWNQDQVEERVRELSREFDPPLLIEEFVPGRRLHAIVLGTRVLEVLPISETVVRPDDQVEEVILAQLEAGTADRVREVARRAFRVMACRDCAQIDFRIDDEDNPSVIDVRPALDFGRGGPLATSAEASDRRFAGVVTEIARQALRRARLLQGADDDGDRGIRPTSAPAPAADVGEATAAAEDPEHVPADE